MISLIPTIEFYSWNEHITKFVHAKSHTSSFIYSVDFSRAKSWVAQINHKSLDLQKIFMHIYKIAIRNVLKEIWRKNERSP